MMLRIHRSIYLLYVEVILQIINSLIDWNSKELINEKRLRIRQRSQDWCLRMYFIHS